MRCESAAHCRGRAASSTTSDYAGLDIIRSDYAQKRASSEVEVAKSKFYPVIDVFGTVDGNRTGDAGF